MLEKIIKLLKTINNNDIQLSFKNNVAIIHNYDYAITYNIDCVEYMSLARFDNGSERFTDIYTPKMQLNDNKNLLQDTLQYDFEIELANMLDNIYLEYIKGA